jgi:type II secretory pathway component GspD/PulD (secretin)
MTLASPRRTGLPGSLVDAVTQAGPAFQVFGSFLDNIQVDFLMRATQMDARSSSVEAPRLVVFNQRSAVINVTTMIYYVASPGFLPVGGSGTGGQSAPGQMPNVSMLPKGTRFQVQPTVSADRKYVTMEVRPYFTDVRLAAIPVNQIGAIAGLMQLPEMDITTIQTTVRVPDRGWLLLGGLKLSGETEVEAGVPILSKVPILKRAFTNRSHVRDESVMLVLIKPTVIIQDEQEDEAYGGDMITSENAGI